MTLLLLRLLPYIMALFARLVALTPSIGLLAGARHLARTTGNYHAPLILLVLTLSLSTFTSTLAQTLDKHLNDQHYYEIGSDARLVEFGDMPGSGGSVGSGSSEEEAFWVFLPVSEHLNAPGVNAAARVARSEMTVYPPIGPQPAVLFGIDRVDYSRSAFWRDDFAASSLGELMNQLALTTEGVLVPRSFLETHRLKPGDNLPASLYKLSGNHELDLKIVGAFDYFPSWYPDQGPLLVANLDYIFEQVGGEFPYEVWLSLDPGADQTAILQSLHDLSLNVSYSKFAQATIDEAKIQPERQGLFGLLSVGFTALAFLTTLGFLLYAFFSFRRRFIELGILRAIGLSAGQMMILLGVELAVLLGIGLGAGTALGVGVSNLFIPYLQVGTEQTARIPPFLVQIDWSSVFQVYVLFILLFIAALSILAVLLLRMKVFQAVKLGETV
jgi:putative ABC transport system permease protein